MREIKDKAWHLSKKEMLSDEKLKNFRQAIIFQKQNKVVLLQFTGFKDCNGVEIYEGDTLLM